MDLPAEKLHRRAHGLRRSAEDSADGRSQGSEDRVYAEGEAKIADPVDELLDRGGVRQGQYVPEAKPAGTTSTPCRRRQLHEVVRTSGQSQHEKGEQAQVRHEAGDRSDPRACSRSINVNHEHDGHYNDDPAQGVEPQRQLTSTPPATIQPKNHGIITGTRWRGCRNKKRPSTTDSNRAPQVTS